MNCVLKVSDRHNISGLVHVYRAVIINKSFCSGKQLHRENDYHLTSNKLVGVKTTLSKEGNTCMLKITDYHLTSSRFDGVKLFLHLTY